MASSYTLTFVNNTSNQGDVCLYQDPANLGLPAAVPLAWQVHPSFPGTSTAFKWEEQYEFVWAETGALRPGVTFVPREHCVVAAGSSDQIKFEELAGVRRFSDQRPSPQPGQQVINVGPSVSPNRVAVGIGMAGRGILAVQAGPNLAYAFALRPAYWIAFGSFDPGEVLDVKKLVHPAEVPFPAGVFAMTATLDDKGNWTIA